MLLMHTQSSTCRNSSHCTCGNCSQLKVRIILWSYIMFKVNFAEYVFWCKSRTSPVERPSINRSQAGRRLLDQLTTMSDTLKPSLPFHSCHFLCSLAPRPLPLHSGLLPVFSLYLDFFSSLWTAVLFFPQAPSLFLSVPHGFGQ